MNGAISLLVCSLAVAADPTPNVVTVKVEPTELTLSHPRFGQRLLVTGLDNGGRSVDLTAEVQWSAREKSVADVQNGRIVPRGNGDTVVSALVAGKQLEVPVHVTDFKSNPPISLRLELEPMHDEGRL